MDGIRRQSTVNGTTTDFVIDNSVSVRERDHTTGSNLATYLVGARGPEYRRDDATGQIRWYVYDGLGSVLGEVDPSGNLSSSRKYDVYGLIRGGNNPSGTSNHKFVGKFGHSSEDSTGLIYMRARYYDPTLGRFASEDPAQHGRNWFIYCDNTPVNEVDPTGLFSFIDISGAQAILLRGEAAAGAAAISVLSTICPKLADLVEIEQEVLSIEVRIDPLGNGDLLDTIEEMGISAENWRKAYIYLEHLSGDYVKVHSIAEIVDGVIKQIGTGAWKEWTDLVTGGKP